MVEHLPNKLQALVSGFNITKKIKVTGFGAVVMHMKSLACLFELQFVPVLPTSHLSLLPNCLSC